MRFFDSFRFGRLTSFLGTTFVPQFSRRFVSEALPALLNGYTCRSDAAEICCRNRNTRTAGFGVSSYFRRSCPDAGDKGRGRITVCRPAHDRQSSSEYLPEPVSDRPSGRVKQHARPRETHDASHLFPHGRPVTMNGTAAATRFRFAENASVQPVVRIPDQGGAFGARYRMSLLFPAVQADHVFYGAFFPVYS